MDKAKNDELPIHIYKSSGLKRVLSALIVIHVVITFVIITQGSTKFWLVFVFFPIYGVMIWAIVKGLGQAHLVIYKNGLEYRFGNVVCFSNWEDLERFEIRSLGKPASLALLQAISKKGARPMRMSQCSQAVTKILFLLMGFTCRLVRMVAGRVQSWTPRNLPILSLAATFCTMPHSCLSMAKRRRKIHETQENL